MADQAPHNPVYHQTEVVTDPEAPEAVQIPEGLNDGSQPGPHPLTEQTPNEFFGDVPGEQPHEPAHSVGPDVPAVPPEPADEDQPSYEDVRAEQEADAEQPSSDEE